MLIVSPWHRYHLYPKGLIVSGKICMASHYCAGKIGLFLTCSQTLSNTLLPFIKHLLNMCYVLQMDRAEFRKLVVLNHAFTRTVIHV